LGRIAGAAVLLVAGPASSVPFTPMFERDDNVGGGEEPGLRRDDSFEDVFGNVCASDASSPIDLAANVSSTGLMAHVDFDGGQPPPCPRPRRR
jgi:hypothetical protein